MPVPQEHQHLSPTTCALKFHLLYKFSQEWKKENEYIYHLLYYYKGTPFMMWTYVTLRLTLSHIILQNGLRSRSQSSLCACAPILTLTNFSCLGGFLKTLSRLRSCTRPCILWLWLAPFFTQSTPLTTWKGWQEERNNNCHPRFLSSHTSGFHYTISKIKDFPLSIVCITRFGHESHVLGSLVWIYTNRFTSSSKSIQGFLVSATDH